MNALTCSSASRPPEASLRHELHDTMVDQTAFVEAFREQDSIVSSLLEGAVACEAWLRRLASSLSGSDHA